MRFRLMNTMNQIRVHNSMNEEVYKLPQSSVLDLHHFNPNEVAELVGEFIWSCKQNGIASMGSLFMAKVRDLYVKQPIRC